MNFWSLLIFALATVDITLAAIEPDYDGEYIINDRSLVEALKNVDQAVVDVVNFWDDLKQTDPDTPHLLWIEDFAQVLKVIKKIFRQSRIKVSDYTPQLVEISKKKIDEINTNLPKNNQIKFNVEAFLNYPQEAFGKEISLRHGFAGLDANYSSILNANKENFVLVLNNWSKILTHLDNIVDVFNKLQVKMFNNLKSLIGFVRMNRESTKQINAFLDCINGYPINGATPEQLQELKNKMKSANAAANQFIAYREINKCKASLQQSFFELDNLVHLFPIILQNILSANPTMLVNKERIKRMIETILTVSRSIHEYETVDMQNAKTPQTWLTTLIDFQNIKIKFILKMNAEVSMLNGEDVDEFIEYLNGRVEFNSLQRLHPSMRSFYGRIQTIVKKPDRVLASLTYDFVPQLFQQHTQTIKNFTPDDVIRVNAIIENYYEKMSNLLEKNNLEEVTRPVNAFYANLLQISYNLREKIFTLEYLSKWMDGDYLRAEAEEILKGFDKALDQAIIQMDSQKFRDDAAVELKRFTKKFREVNGYQLDLIRDLEDYFVNGPPKGKQTPNKLRKQKPSDSEPSIEKKGLRAFLKRLTPKRKS